MQTAPVDCENAPYRVRSSSVKGMAVVLGKQSPGNGQSRYDVVLFIGTPREADAVARALNDLAAELGRQQGV